MREVVYDIDLNLQEYDIKACMQNDDINLIINIYENEKPYDLAGAKATLNWSKPDGTPLKENMNIDKNMISVILNKDYTDIKGKARLDIEITKEGTISTFPLVLVIVEKVFQSNKVNNKIVELLDIIKMDEYVDEFLDGIKKKQAELSSQIDENVNLINARMDTFTKLEEGSTTGDAELIDIRVGIDGTVYENAGTAVRSQIGTLTEKTEKIDTLDTIITGNIKSNIKEYTLNATQYVKALFITQDMELNKKYYFKINSYSGIHLKNISIFLYREDETYRALYDFTKVQSYKVGDEQYFEVDEVFTKIRFNVNFDDGITVDEGVLSVNFGEYIEQQKGLAEKVEELSEKVNNTKGINVLIFGDSYSAQKRWINSLSNFITIDNIINLGVSGARLRDSYTDRETYPYSDRPILGGTGNNNILASQIEKLKRLMTGTDLDSGETQIYENTTPDIILIELGKNDYSDNDTKYENYLYEIFEKIEDNYVKTSATSTPTVRNFYKPKDVENLDRTCFVGALAYAYSELHKIFPKALIFFISNSNLWNLTTEPDRDYRKHYQIKKACELMSIPLIDWYAEGLTPNFLAYWEGEGTESNPYLSYLPSELTLDELHPNDKGAELLGLKTATYIEPYLKFIKKMKYQ